MIQIRNVPDEIHRTLKSRAALAGMTLSDYLLEALRHLAVLPTNEEMVARLYGHEQFPEVAEKAAEIIREIRGE